MESQKFFQKRDRSTPFISPRITKGGLLTNCSLIFISFRPQAHRGKNDLTEKSESARRRNLVRFLLDTHVHRTPGILYKDVPVSRGILSWQSGAGCFLEGGSAPVGNTRQFQRRVFAIS